MTYEELQQLMYEIDLGKVSVTPEGAFDISREYEVLSITTKNGQSYLSLKQTKGVDPTGDTGMNDWMCLAERGESLYQMFVRTGRYSGTEAQFLDQYQSMLDACKKATADAIAATANTNKVATQIRSDVDVAIGQLAEAVTASNAATSDTISATNNAVAETNKTRIATANAITATENADDMAAKAQAATAATEVAIRKLNDETAKAMASNANLQKAEETSNANENQRVANEKGRVSAEETRAAEHATLKSDSTAATSAANTAANAANAAAEACNATNTTVSESEAKRVTNEAARVKSENARVSEHATLKSASEEATTNANSAATKANEAALKLQPVIDNDKLQDEKLRTLEGQMAVSEEVSAQALLEQANDIEGLKKVVTSILTGTVYLPNVLTRKVQIDGCDSVLFGEDVPSTAPEFIGQEYIDTAHKIAYKACGKENISDWKPINVA